MIKTPLIALLTIMSITAQAAQPTLIYPFYKLCCQLRYGNMPSYTHNLELQNANPEELEQKILELAREAGRLMAKLITAHRNIICMQPTYSIPKDTDLSKNDPEDAIVVTFNSSYENDNGTFNTEITESYKQVDKDLNDAESKQLVEFKETLQEIITQTNNGWETILAQYKKDLPLNASLELEIAVKMKVLEVLCDKCTHNSKIVAVQTKE